MRQIESRDLRVAKVFRARRERVRDRGIAAQELVAIENLEHAVFATLGYRAWLIGRLVIGEGVMLAVIGGVLGAALSVGVLEWASLSMSMDGVSMNVEARASTLLLGLLLSGALGIAAGLVPAWQVSRRPIAGSLRSA